MQWILTLVAAAAVLALVGCAGESKGTAGDPMDKLAGEWSLRQLDGTDIAALVPADARAPTLAIERDGKVSGFAGVNRMAGSLDMAALSRGEFKTRQLALTRMAGPPALMDLESRYTQRLGEVTAYSTDGRSLQLKRGSETVMKFAKAGG